MLKKVVLETDTTHKTGGQHLSISFEVPFSKNNIKTVFLMKIESTTRSTSSNYYS